MAAEPKHPPHSSGAADATVHAIGIGRKTKSSLGLKIARGMLQGCAGCRRCNEG